MSLVNNSSDVSRRALSVARMIDRLGAGKFTITIIKGESGSERWQIEISQPVTLQKKDLVHENPAPENVGITEAEGG